MHIKTYLNDFHTLQSKQNNKLTNIFTNLNTSKKTFKKSNLQQKDLQCEYSIPVKNNNKKLSDSAFDDQIFTALYKINRKLSYERYNTLGQKNQTPKLSFKLNYVENHRPIIKQKMIQKLTYNRNLIETNQPQQQKKNFQPNLKKSKIEKYITKNNGTAIIKFNNKQKNFSIKQKLLKSGHRNDSSKISFDIDRYRTLSSRKVQSSLGNYQPKRLSSGKSSHFFHTPEKQRSLSRIDLPQYALNILKPCKIQGIELIDRPVTNISKRTSIKNSKNVNQTTQKKLSFSGLKQDEQWNIRVIQTARQSNRKPLKLNQSCFRNPQKSKTQKKAELQPWDQQFIIDQDQDNILFSLE